MKNRVVILIACALIVLSVVLLAVYMTIAAKPPEKAEPYSEDSFESNAAFLAEQAVLRAKFDVYSYEEGNGTVRLFTAEQVESFLKPQAGEKQAYLTYDEVLFLINDSVRLYHEYDEIILTGERELFTHRTDFADIHRGEGMNLHIDARCGKGEQTYAEQSARYDEMIEDIYQIIVYRLTMLDHGLRMLDIFDSDGEPQYRLSNMREYLAFANAEKISKSVLVLALDDSQETCEEALPADGAAYFNGTHTQGLSTPLLVSRANADNKPVISLVDTDGTVTELFPTAELVSSKPTAELTVTGLQNKTLDDADARTVCAAFGMGTKESGTHGCKADYTVTLPDQTASYCADCRVFWDETFCYYPDHETRVALQTVLPSGKETVRDFAQYTHAEGNSVRLFASEQVRALDVVWTGGDRNFVTYEELRGLVADTVRLYETYDEIVLTDGARLGFGEGDGDLHIVPWRGDLESLLYTQAKAQYDRMLADICTVFRYRLYLLDGGTRLLTDTDGFDGIVLLDEGTHRSTDAYLDAVQELREIRDWQIGHMYTNSIFYPISSVWIERIDHASRTPCVMLRRKSIADVDWSDIGLSAEERLFPTQEYIDLIPIDNGYMGMTAVDMHGNRVFVSGEEGAYLFDTVENGTWIEGAPDCDADYVITYSFGGHVNVPLRYHAACGMLSDADGTHLLRLTETQQQNFLSFLPRLTETHGQNSDEPYSVFAWVSRGAMIYYHFGFDTDEAMLAEWFTQGDWQACDPPEKTENGRWYTFVFAQETLYYNRDTGMFYIGENRDRALQLSGEQRNYMQDKIP